MGWHFDLTLDTDETCLASQSEYVNEQAVRLVDP